MEALDKAIEAVGGVTKLAQAVGVAQSAVSNWKVRGIPAEKCKAIEEATGGVVKRHQLRPDIFDAPSISNGQAA